MSVKYHRWFNSRILHTRVAVIGLLILLIFSKSGWPDDRPIHELIQWSGYFFILVGVGIRIFCSIYIGGQKNEAVMTDGPFSVVRNPLYCGSLIAAIGIGLQTTSLILTAAIIMTFVLYYSIIIKKEEIFLEGKFGLDYQQYKQHVPRWIPAFSQWKSPPHIVVKPYFVARTILDSLGFMLVIPFFELLHNVQNTYLNTILLYIF